MKRDEKGWKEIKKDVENDIVHVSNCPLVKRYDCENHVTKSQGIYLESGLIEA